MEGRRLKERRGAARKSSERRLNQRRKYQRLNYNFEISYRIIKQQHDYNISSMMNISKGGIMLTMDKKFEVGVNLALNIKIPLIPQNVEVIGEIVESEELLKDKRYETRVKFVLVNPSEVEFMECLNNYIEKNKKI